MCARGVWDVTRARTPTSIAQNAGKAGAAWSICSVCVPSVAAEARQLEVEPALIRRAWCAARCSAIADEARTAAGRPPALLSRILRRHRPAPPAGFNVSSMERHLANLQSDVANVHLRLERRLELVD